MTVRHHFADLLAREQGHWTISPNADRWAAFYDDLEAAPLDCRQLTLTRQVKNWRRVLALQNLSALTLDRPSQQQIDVVSQLTSLRALRISHSRSKNLRAISALGGLEELVLEYVSGIRDMAAIGAITSLRALHVENLRNVRDFSGLRTCVMLRQLNMHGTWERYQPIEGFAFLRPMKRLEALNLGWVRPMSAEPTDFENLVSLKRVTFGQDVFDLDFFAWFQVHYPHVEGAVQAPFQKRGGSREQVLPPDISATMPEDELRQFAAAIEIDADGTRWRHVRNEASLLGRGEGLALGLKDTVDARCEAHAERYRQLLEKHASKPGR